MPLIIVIKRGGSIYAYSAAADEMSSVVPQMLSYISQTPPPLPFVFDEAFVRSKYLEMEVPSNSTPPTYIQLYAQALAI